MKTIRRNSKRIKNLIQNAKFCRAYSLSNGFSGTEVALDRLPGLFETFVDRSARFSGDDDSVTVQIHSNLWYVIQD